MKEFLDIKYGNEPLQMLDVYIPDCESFPVFVYFHGGGIEAGKKENFFIPYLVEKGVAVVSANYRMYPDAKYPDMSGANPIPVKPVMPENNQEFDPKFFSSTKSDYEDDDDDFKRKKRQGYE